MFNNHFIQNVRVAVSDQLNLTKKQRKKKKSMGMSGGTTSPPEMDKVIDTVIYRFTTYYRKKMLKEREDTFCDKNVDMNERVIKFD